MVRNDCCHQHCFPHRKSSLSFRTLNRSLAWPFGNRQPLPQPGHSYKSRHVFQNGSTGKTQLWFWHLGDDVIRWFYLTVIINYSLKARNQTTCTENLKSKTYPTKYPKYNSRTNESYIELPPEKTEPVQFFRSHAPQVVPDALTMRATKGTWIFGIAERSLPMGICQFAVQMMDDQRNAIFKNYRRLLSWCTQNFIKLAGRWWKLESFQKKKTKIKLRLLLHPRNLT